MDDDASPPGSPGDMALQAASPDRLNQQRDSLFASLRSEGRDSAVHEKISQFNNMSMSMQSKHLERKTADAALKRAMLGREEAEGDLRRLREENKGLRKEIEHGKDRERRVGERLEAVMENYGRTKETHAHTQALWEKEIRRARKETFKTQSSIVKLQEELKSAKAAAKGGEEAIEHEKERSKVREQEAFTARYQLVGVQEKLDEALERVKVIEQERDAFRTAAQQEEIARIAAEGRIPLPQSTDPDDEFASPQKDRSLRASKASRVSLSTMDVVSSAASEMEIEELSMQLQWERQRADRAQEMAEFLQAECEMACCPCSRSKHRASLRRSLQKRRESGQMTVAGSPLPQPRSPIPEDLEDPEELEAPMEVVAEVPETHDQDPSETPADTPREPSPPRSKKEPRRSTIFCPREGTFRTVSEEEAITLEAREYGEAMNAMDLISEGGWESEHQPEPEPPSSVQPEVINREYARTPSVDPPAFALLAQERTSLASLLHAPYSEPQSAPLPSLHSAPSLTRELSQEELKVEEEYQERDLPEPRPHTSIATYSVTTTKVPLQGDNYQPSSSFGDKLRTPSQSSNRSNNTSNASFDQNDPALTPTMTREQALAKIRERRGRARSAATGATMASKNKRAAEGDRRDLSAPVRKKTRS